QIAMTATPFDVEPVTVTATRTPIAAAASPLPTASLGGDALRRTRGVSLAHVLEDLPGVRALSTGAQIGKPVVRGLAGSRVLVLENGSRLEDYSWSDEDGPSVETGFVRRVEVIRGPASVLYGSDALGGVVNVISEQLPDAAGGPGFVRSGFQLSGATNNAEVGAGARLEGARSRLGWRVAGVGRFAASLRTPAGELENTGFGAVNGEGTTVLHGSRGAVSLRVVHYGGEFKLLEASGPDTAAGGREQGGPERKLSDQRLQLVAERSAGPWRLEAKGQYQRHSLMEVSDDTVPGGGGLLTESTAFDLLLQTTSLDVLAHHAAGQALRGTLGLSGLAQWNDARGRIPLVPNARASSAAVFAFEQLALGGPGGKWSLLAGARLDGRRLVADSNATLGLSPQTRRYGAWAADAGVVWRPLEALAVSGNIGRAWRAPTLFELFANGPHLGEARYEQGDPGLRPETGTSLDVGLRWSAARLRLEAAGYRNRLTRYIYITPTSQFKNSLRVYQYVPADAKLIGGELGVEAQTSRALTVHARVDGVRGTNLATHEWLPLMPPLRAGLGVEWEGTIGLDVEAYAKQRQLNPLDVSTGGYTLLHLSAGTTTTLLGRPVRLDVAVRNVLNTRYRSFLSRYKEFALDPGWNLIVRLSSGDVE
ncbi:MAG: hypothetical protein AUH46_00920, partial [Gemmatimonadetes bacterium 13_1_40CM_70_15]